MKNTIPAEKLITEIKIIQRSLESRDVRFNQVKKIQTECLIEFCKCIIDTIYALQQEQPEADLEKEIDAVWNPRFNLGWNEKSLLSINHSAFETIARHFYELGLNARKV